MSPLPHYSEFFFLYQGEMFLLKQKVSEVGFNESELIYPLAVNTALLSKSKEVPGEAGQVQELSADTQDPCLWPRRVTEEPEPIGQATPHLPRRVH